MGRENILYLRMGNRTRTNVSSDPETEVPRATTNIKTKKMCSNCEKIIMETISYLYIDGKNFLVPLILGYVFDKRERDAKNGFPPNTVTLCMRCSTVLKAIYRNLRKFIEAGHPESPLSKIFINEVISKAPFNRTEVLPPEPVAEVYEVSMNCQKENGLDEEHDVEEIDDEESEVEVDEYDLEGHVMNIEERVVNGGEQLVDIAEDEEGDKRSDEGDKRSDEGDQRSDEGDQRSDEGAEESGEGGDDGDEECEDGDEEYEEGEEMPGEGGGDREGEDKGRDEGDDEDEGEVDDGVDDGMGFTCSYCKVLYENKAYAVDHCRSCIKNPKLWCPVCHRFYRTVKEVDDHVALVHPTPPEDIPNIPIPILNLEDPGEDSDCQVVEVIVASKDSAQDSHPSSSEGYSSADGSSRADPVPGPSHCQYSYASGSENEEEAEVDVVTLSDDDDDNNNDGDNNNKDDDSNNKEDDNNNKDDDNNNNGNNDSDNESIYITDSDEDVEETLTCHEVMDDELSNSPPILEKFDMIKERCERKKQSGADEMDVVNDRNGYLTNEMNGVTPKAKISENNVQANKNVHRQDPKARSTNGTLWKSQAKTKPTGSKTYEREKPSSSRKIRKAGSGNSSELKSQKAKNSYGSSTAKNEGLMKKKKGKKARKSRGYDSDYEFNLTLKGNGESLAARDRERRNRATPKYVYDDDEDSDPSI